MNRIGDWKQTHTNRAVYPLDPRAEDIVMADVAHALAQEVRYAGHAPWPYSVAQHSVYVSLRVEFLSRERGDDLTYTVELSKAALLHDAHEYVLKDIPSPLKQYVHVAHPLGTMPYRELERRWDLAITARFNVAAPLNHPLIKQADLELLATEAKVFFPVEFRPREWQPLPEPLQGFSINEWEWWQARTGFLSRWAELGGGL